MNKTNSDSQIANGMYKGIPASFGGEITTYNISLLHDTFYTQVQDKENYWNKQIGTSVSISIPKDINGRRAALVENWRKQNAAIQITATTTSRLVTGMGLPHPKENGFAWMRPYGIPYIPGSSVKGMLLGWLKSGWAEKEFDCCKLWGTQEAMGEIIFLDALPEAKTNSVSLEIDVMTPHYGDYYSANESQLNNCPPADWYDPNPIKFLTVAVGQCFRFEILIPQKFADKRENLETELETELSSALELFGIGAKTASGYGRFEIAPKSTKPMPEDSA